MSRLFMVLLMIQAAMAWGAEPNMPPTYPRRAEPVHLTQRRTNNYNVFYAENRVRNGIPLGGIGAGFVELRHDGTFYNWMIANNTPKGVGDFLKFPDPQGLDRDPGEAVMFFLLTAAPTLFRRKSRAENARCSCRFPVVTEHSAPRKTRCPLSS
jgi:hypothetical protein